MCFVFVLPAAAAQARTLKNTFSHGEYCIFRLCAFLRAAKKKRVAGQTSNENAPRRRSEKEEPEPPRQPPTRTQNMSILGSKIIQNSVKNVSENSFRRQAASKSVLGGSWRLHSGSPNRPKNAPKSAKMDPKIGKNRPENRPKNRQKILINRDVPPLRGPYQLYVMSFPSIKITHKSYM